MKLRIGWYDGIPLLLMARVGTWQLLIWLGPGRLIKSRRIQVHRVSKPSAARRSVGGRR